MPIWDAHVGQVTNSEATTEGNAGGDLGGKFF